MNVVGLGVREELGQIGATAIRENRSVAFEIAADHVCNLFQGPALKFQVSTFAFESECHRAGVTAA